MLDKAPDSIRSNLAAEVTLRLGSESNASKAQNYLYIPASSVSKDEKGSFVYVIGPSDTPGAAVVKRRTVKVGELSELGIEITDGLKVGERVMTAGQINARDGMLVRGE